MGSSLFVGHFICVRFVFSSEIAPKYRSLLIQENHLYLIQIGVTMPTQVSDVYPVRNSLELRKILYLLLY